MSYPVARSTLLAAVDVRVRGEPHAFEPHEQAAIEADFARRAAANPRLWNGPFYLFDRIDVGEAFLRAEGAPTDFATFMYWRKDNPPSSRFIHVSPTGALVTTDRRLLVGRMSRHTANAGRLYCPSGSFDPNDLVTEADGIMRLDPEANMRRELAEECGLDASGFAVRPGFLLVENGPRRLTIVRIFEASATSAELAPGIEAHIATDAEEELDGFEFLPFDARLPAEQTVPYVNAVLDHLERGG